MRGLFERKETTFAELDSPEEASSVLNKCLKNGLINEDENPRIEKRGLGNTYHPYKWAIVLELSPGLETKHWIPKREKLPNRRQTATFDFEHSGITYHGSVSWYPDGRPAEVFLNAGKAGTHVDIVSRDLAVVISLALQYGVPVGALKTAFLRLNDGGPAGPGGKLTDILAEEFDFSKRRASDGS